MPVTLRTRKQNTSSQTPTSKNVQNANENQDSTDLLFKEFENESPKTKSSRQSEMFMFIDDSKFAEILNDESPTDEYVLESKLEDFGSVDTFSKTPKRYSRRLSNVSISPSFSRFSNENKNTRISSPSIPYSPSDPKRRGKKSTDTVPQQLDAKSSSETGELSQEQLEKFEKGLEKHAANNGNDKNITPKNNSELYQIEKTSVDSDDSKQETKPNDKDVQETNGQKVKPVSLSQLNKVSTYSASSTSSSTTDILDKKFIRKAPGPIATISWLTDSTVGNELPFSVKAKNEEENKKISKSKNLKSRTKKAEKGTGNKKIKEKKLVKRKQEKNSKSTTEYDSLNDFVLDEESVFV
ncbi:hypothetical protein BB559_002958 [Furculomyces boomerangus]|uniref:Uncharacterized protein n=1 Tax=Furculomyces boomerangus TaxID=61424 RepID=A0A2T9YQU8_9FUNG|nr:hypothetical protein BB559_002958 [Furculomyces boomerangus]